METTTLKQLQCTTKIVEMILKECPETRNSDGVLYVKVIEFISNLAGCKQPFQKMTVERFFNALTTLPVPPFETVRRTRQKLQRQNPELSAPERIKRKRADKEAAFRIYAKEG